MLRNSDQARELYIPDFKLWNDYYEKKVKSHKGPEQSPQQACSSQANESASAVKLQFVSPVTETTNQAASIMKTGNSKLSKKSKSKKSGKAAKGTQGAKKVQKRKQKDSGKTSFSYRKLNDIFSKKRK